MVNHKKVIRITSMSTGDPEVLEAILNSPTYAEYYIVGVNSTLIFLERSLEEMPTSRKSVFAEVKPTTQGAN